MPAADDLKSLSERVARLEATLQGFKFPFPIGPIADPAGPIEFGHSGGGFRPPHLPIGDSAPIDISRFSVAQLQSSLHSINAEKTRLAAMEELVKQELNKSK